MGQVAKKYLSFQRHISEGRVRRVNIQAAVRKPSRILGCRCRKDKGSCSKDAAR
jgi:hypothetical protein